MRFLIIPLVVILIGCGGDEVVVSRQVLEIISPSAAVVTAPPEELWDWIKPDERYFTPRASLEAEQRAFYSKYVDAGGIAILAHAEMVDQYLAEARQVILTMTLKYPALRDRLKVRGGFYMILFKHATGPDDRAQADAPEFLTKHGYYHERTWCRMSYWDEGVQGYCSASVAQEHMGRMSTLVHEFAHALDSEMERLNPGFVDRLREAYQQAKASGVYRDKWDPYIITENYREYWAEGAEIWYYGIGEDREFETHQAFAEVDPLLYKLLSEWFYQGSFSRDPIPGVPQYDIMWKQSNQ